MNLSTAFHPQMEKQVKRTIQTLEDMLRSYVIDFCGSCVDYLPLIEFTYNNSYHSRIGMAHFEALYGRRCRTLIRWFEVDETRLFDLDLVHRAIKKVKVI